MEAAIRAKNRQEDHIRREERDGIATNKLRLKKSDKKRLDGYLVNARNTSHLKKTVT